VELSRNSWTAGLFSAGKWRGREALRENLRRVEIDFEPLDAEILAILVEGDRTALRWVSRWRHRATGETYTMDMAHFLRWRGELVAEMIEFMGHHCESVTASPPPLSLKEMAAERDQGLDREEIARRIASMGNFSGRGPDVALLRLLCSPDVVCEFVGERSAIAYAGRHRGIESLTRIVRTIDVEFEQLGQAAPQIVVEGCGAAALRTVEWRHRGTGRRGLVELADFVRFENGLIVELVEFRDSVALLAD
jgi:ketosteroid isomerase-like protein